MNAWQRLLHMRSFVPACTESGFSCPVTVDLSRYQETWCLWSRVLLVLHAATGCLIQGFDPCFVYGTPCACTALVQILSHMVRRFVPQHLQTQLA